MGPTAKRKRDDSLLTSIDTAIYSRPNRSFRSTDEDLVFQLLECEDASKDKHDDDTSLIRLHGVTQEGASIIVLVRGFKQYLYFPVTPAFTEADYAAFEEGIHANTKSPVAFDHFEIVKRDPLEYFRDKPQDYQRYVKIYVKKPTDIVQIGNILSKSDELPKLLNMYTSGKLYSSQVYETGLSFDMRFMADLGIVGCGWLRLDQGKYQELKTAGPPYERVSGVFECQYEAIVGLSPNSTEANDEKTRNWSKLPDLRCLIVSCVLLDGKPAKKSVSLPNSPKKPKTSKIVAAPRTKAVVPTEDNPDPFITHISMILTTSPLAPSSDDQIILLTHGGANDSNASKVIKNLEVFSFVDEKAMLHAFRSIFLSYDPDVVSGYDITSEAIPSILYRALDLGLSKDFINLARCSHVSLKTKRRQIYSGAWLKKERKMNATSNREHTELGCIGRLVLDLRTVIEREERLRTYTINESSAVIGGRTLEYLSDPVLYGLWNGDSTDDRARLGDYCLHECSAALNIMRKHASLITYIELSRVTGLNFEDVVSRGQMRRFWGQLFRFCGARGVIVPAQSRGGGQMTQSALNYMPEVGYDTENPVVVLDFKSLYPSILIARNLCFSTEVRPGDDFEGSSWTGFGGCKFVGSDVKEGIVPQILKHFLSERSKVKTLMKNATDPGMRIVLDGRQKAIKVCANAVYGFFGASESRLQNMAIADATITEGANLLEAAKQEIEKRYNTTNSTKDIRVVYGDTDSVFVKCFGGKSVAEAIEMGKQMSAEVSKVWPDPISLDFEKVLFPSLLQNRKRYAGLLWTNPEKPDEIDVKGIEVNRRDAVPLIGHVIGDIFKILFPHKNNDATGSGTIPSEERQGIIEQVKDSVRTDVGRILSGELNVGSYIMTKGLWLGTNASDYNAKQTHISVIDKMRTRDSRRMFKDGERISYIFTQSTPNSKGYEKAEDPVYAINKGLLLDYQYYLEHTVHNPVQRILELFMSNKEVEALFKVTKSAKVAVSKASGVMGAFLSAGKKAASRCEVCGDQCTRGKLCAKHKDQASELAGVKKQKLLDRRQAKKDTDETCYTCQQSRREILCVNMDCEVYFNRTKVNEEVQATEDDLSNFVASEAIKLDW
ncbi:DNA polymerase [Taphrina deformans PYCC 5710]|uniref:DNA polymerase n=1 Tax=Taphrina deformans (strain PYCC 5710 / ATCC 11124 / CBS 356.35 / IMI 108563 / JCM 9778 / NBRC 8474) TaxID=1097556 RepID=R4X8B7_TAPDE|nr:DNA polymerase [Taphrina deformans PYCC 5710]|eukprot:CCG81793.1 DNA polymerase [Taphrina deformans PYCC 5710]